MQAPTTASLPPPAAARVLCGLWCLSHLAWPLWYPPSGSGLAAAALFAALATAGGLMFWRLRPALTAPCGRGEAPREGAPLGSAVPPHARPWLTRLFLPPGDWVPWALAALVVLPRAYPLTLPIHYFQGGDEGVHMGLPALPFKVWARNATVPFPVVFWALAAALWLARRPVLQAARLWWVALTGLRAWALAASAGLLAAYGAGVFAGVNRFQAAGHPNLPLDLVRYPPLSKFLRFPFYAGMGVSSLAGRLPEFLLFLASGALLYRLVSDYRSKAAARAALALFWFLPPFSYYSMRGSQTNGEAFFLLLTFWFLAHWAMGPGQAGPGGASERAAFEGGPGSEGGEPLAGSGRGSPEPLWWAVAAVSAGCMYRYTLPVLAIVLAGVAAWLAWRDPELRRPGRGGAVGMLAVLGLFIVPWGLPNYLYELRPYDPTAQSLSWGSLALTPASVPTAVSWPAALLLGAGLLHALARPKDALQRGLLAWVAAFYLFIAADLPDNIRLTLPLYPPLIIWTAELLSRSGGVAAAVAGLAAWAYLAAVTTVLPGPAMRPEFTLRLSLATEYVPLDDAARFLARLPEGSRVLGVDTGQGAFSLYLKRPAALRWSQVRAADVASADELAARCREEQADVVLYAAGPPEAFGEAGNPALFAAFEADASRFPLVAEARRGPNRVRLAACPGGAGGPPGG